MANGTDNLQDDRENRNLHFRSKEQKIEVSVFLFLIVPSMIMSFFLVKEGNVSFVLIALSIILRDLALVSLVLFFLWRNKESPEAIGWRFRNGLREAVLGAWLFIPFTFSAGLLETALHRIGFSAPATRLPLIAEKNTVELILAGVLVMVVALAEETIFRGYLILRFKNITANIAAAVLASAAIFSLGHGYEGSVGVITVAFMGLVFAVVYLWRQSLIAPMVMHFLQNFIGIVLLPLLGR